MSPTKRKKSVPRAARAAGAELPAAAVIDELTDAQREQRAAIDAAFQLRDKLSPNAPSEEPRHTVTPLVGPNPDGLAHMIVIAYATDTDEQALIAADLAASLASGLEAGKAAERDKSDKEGA